MPSKTQEGPVSAEDIVLKLPHPYLTEYALDRATSRAGSRSGKLSQTLYRIVPSQTSAAATKGAAPLPTSLHHPRLFFTEISTLKSSELPPHSNNTAWARARRSPGCTFLWDGSSSNNNGPPTLAQAWLLVYVLFTIQPGMEHFRLGLEGKGAGLLGRQMKDVALAVDLPVEGSALDDDDYDGNDSQVLVLRSTFWQGAGSPFGPRPIWLPESSPASLAAAASSSPVLSTSYPPTPLQHAITYVPMGDSRAGTHLARHPLRPAKPRPGSVIYSRFIPHLRETFSMIVLDPSDATHLDLFHTWQNDPRVSQGWNESGTLEHHRAYLTNLHRNPAQIPVLARFDDVCFAYFEIYWAKEDRLGAYFDAGDFDRGRHSLVGDVRYRGPHRVSAWWSSLMHYMFLDEPRTMNVVGEPKETNTTVVMYDLMHGFGLERFVDLPHKRSALVKCTRERFFELCPLGDNEKVVGGIKLGLVPKL